MNTGALLLSLFKVKNTCTEKHEYEYKASGMKIRQCFLQFMYRCLVEEFVCFFFPLGETSIIIFSQEQLYWSESRICFQEEEQIGSICNHLLPNELTNM